MIRSSVAPRATRKAVAGTIILALLALLALGSLGAPKASGKIIALTNSWCCTVTGAGYVSPPGATAGGVSPILGRLAPTRRATCTLSTTADSVIPGFVKELKRAIWQLGPVRVYDGGADGDAETQGDNTLFATQGIFVP